MLIFFSVSCQKKIDQHDGDQVFRYNEHANISSLDPAFAKDQRNIWACNQLYNGLVKLDDSLNVQPDLAKNWTISDDVLTYTFDLRTDVYFHLHPVFKSKKSRKMTAQDVVYSLQRLNDPELAAPGSWVMQSVKRVDAKNDSVVQIELKQPFPAFLGLLSMQYCSIVPQEMKTLSFRKNPIGTGPFHFKRWEANEKLVFRKNKDYFETDEKGQPLPYLEAVAITFLPDKQSEFLEFAQGNIDFLSGLDPSYKDELLTATGKLNPKYREQVDMLKAPYLNTEYLGFFMESGSPVIANSKVRRAINYGFDRQSMMDFLRNGIGTAANHGFIPKGLPSFSPKEFYSYQPEKARQLVEEFKQESGIDNPKISMSTNPSYLDLVEFIQRELQKIGLQVDIDVMPPSTLRQKRSAGQLSVFRASWIADYPDAENYMSLFYSKNFAPNGPNYTHFQSKAFDSLYEKALRTGNMTARRPLYRKMDSLVMAKAVIAPLFYDEVIRFKRENIKGLGINPRNLLNLTRVRKK